MLIPLGKKIIVKPIEQKHGTLLVSGLKPVQFHVVAVGDEVTKVKASDIVYMDKYAGAEIEHEKEKFLIVEEANILAKLGA